MDSKFPRAVIHIICSIGVTKVIGDIIANNTSPSTKAHKLQLMVGTYVISAMVAEAAMGYVELKMNKFIAAFEKKEETEETEPETEEA